MVSLIFKVSNVGDIGKNCGIDAAGIVGSGQFRITEFIACAGNNFLPNPPGIWAATVAGRLNLCLLAYTPPETNDSAKDVLNKLLRTIKSACCYFLSLIRLSLVP